MSLAAEFSCLSDHDPDSLSVDQARAFIRHQLTAVRTREDDSSAARIPAPPAPTITTS